MRKDFQLTSNRETLPAYILSHIGGCTNKWEYVGARAAIYW